MTLPREPRTAAGRALLSLMVGYDWPNDSVSYVLAIEAEAAGASLREALLRRIAEELDAHGLGPHSKPSECQAGAVLNEVRALAATSASASLDVEPRISTEGTPKEHARAKAIGAAWQAGYNTARAAAAEDTDAQ